MSIGGSFLAAIDTGGHGPGLRAAGQRRRGLPREVEGQRMKVSSIKAKNLKTVKPILSKTRLVSARALKRHLKYMMPEIKLALIKEPGQAAALPIQSPDDLERYVTPMKYYSEEHFVAFHLSARHEVTSYNMVSKGSVSASLVHPREVFKAALLANTYAIIVAHNHPGGSLTASREDLETTEQLIKAGKLLGVSVIDHVIVTVNGISSIRESHPELWRNV